MSDLSEAIYKVDGQHREALQWFADRAGAVVSWAEISAHADTGARLANLAKGIYKPAYTDLALSVKQLISSPYADSDTDFRADGSWSSQYYQEGQKAEERDQFATNRGLINCMEQDVPVGVLLQTKAGRGAQYRILGLARVVGWEDGFFTLEGFSSDGDITQLRRTPGPVAILTKESAKLAWKSDFDLRTIEDVRKRAIAEIVVRRGQPGFRAAILNAYRGKCAITSCDAVEALEAAHITPYLGPESNHAQNGILLRADIHSLFDLGLISINPETLCVRLSDKLRPTVYGEFDGQKFSLPADLASQPSLDALKSHWEWAAI
ncbi:HNH endonuclease [Roseovarius marisflavi]|uniref:HNH endonuclease n=1 Tax=Roseovarius marisflavi TaxID=1054996 RepID=A0A1M6ZSW7_9RHOB|nr:HNH endonuclease [Roseovarius marisflavi]SHL33509.1 HNH endonuclease [Roseovarius marisflavi]